MSPDAGPSPPDHAARRARLRERLRTHDLPALLVSKLVNVRYLTGLDASSAALLVTADGERDVLVTDGRYAERAREHAGDLPVEVTRADDWLVERMAGGGALGLESHTVTWERLRALRDLLDGVDLRAAPGHVEALRQIKDDTELAALRQACAITVSAFEALKTWVAPGTTERQIARRLRDEFLDRGADGAGGMIVASGPNSARPHHAATDRAVQRGDLLKLDVGALVDGYHADMTRVLAFGDPGAKLRDVHEVVRRAQQAGLDAVADGVVAGDVDAASRNLVTAAGYGDAFVHGTGHALGLEIHEAPLLRAGEAATLRSRMTVTVEPGIYLPGLGGVRIEDVVTVTDSGCEILTPAPKDLLFL